MNEANRDSQPAPDEPPGSDAVELGVFWLGARHETAMLEALEEVFMGDLSVEQELRLSRLPQPLVALMHLNGREQLLAEGWLPLPAGAVACLELVLGPGGPELNPVQRGYLKALGRQPMSVYRVVESEPGIGFRLRDLLDDREAERWVAEPLISRSLASQPGMTFGTRLIPGDPWRVARSSFPIQESHLSTLLGEIRAGREAPDAPPERTLRSAMIIYCWLVTLANTQPLYFEEAMREDVH